LAEQALAAAKISVTDKELDAATAHFKRELARRDSTLEGHLAEKRLTSEQFRKQLRWRLLWQKYLQSQLTEERLESYFEKHRRRFDGTELRASHILLKPSSVGDRAEIETLKQRLTAIKVEIAAGRITFDAAAKKDSMAPSAGAGGDVGFFPYRGLMADAFADAAFRLQIGQISQPVVSPFGVHLIQVTETKPGKKPFQQAREKVRNDAASALYQSLVARQRKVTKVAFTGASPYYESKDGKPGSRRLVEAGTSTAKPTIKGASP
jgi:peptidyl-prolyl cis-trans isomerase C